jgi:DNA-binding CsgD family transcriptional regulator
VTHQAFHNPTGGPHPEIVGRGAELSRLEDEIRNARSGKGSVLVLCGAPGSGRSTLLDLAAAGAHGLEVRRFTGVRAEQDLPYAGLQLLCTEVQADLDALEAPLRAALDAAFRSSDDATDPYLVGLATHAILTAPARRQPVLYVVDDAQWLDPASAHALAFALRRLDDHPIAVLLSDDVDASDAFSEFHGLHLGELSTHEAHDLLRAATFGAVDDAVLRRISAEVHGSPRAVLAAASATTCAAFAGGYGVERLSPDALYPYLDRLRKLPADLRRMLVVAAADPTGDPVLFWRAVDTIGLNRQTATVLEDQGWLRLGAQILFTDPIHRAAAYRSASAAERDLAHRALAAATDTAMAEDRRVWHLASATAGVDDDLATALEQCVDTARERCGVAGAAAFRERSTLLTTDPELRTRRALAAAAAKLDAGLPAAAGQMLTTAVLGQPDVDSRRQLDWQLARLSFAEKRNGEAAEQLLRAAQDAATPDAFLEALLAAESAGPFGPGADAVANKVPADDGDDLLNGLAARFSRGYAAGHDLLAPALANDTGQPWITARIAADRWDDGLWSELAAKARREADATGNLATLPHALTTSCLAELHFGHFAEAQRLADRIQVLETTTRAPSQASAAVVLRAWHGAEGPARTAIERARRDATERGDGQLLTAADLAAAVLNNGLGRYDAALTAATAAVRHDLLGFTGWGLVELIEAAARSGRHAAAKGALDELTERAHSSGTEWALGIEARSRALLANNPEPAYQEALERLSKCRVAVHLARAQLVYGEWLRRQGRRADARTQLLAARDSLTAIGASAFAERAHREHLATGEKARRQVHRHAELTPQESSIAVLARQGLTNPEIGRRLFLSPRTVEYHLHKVFEKLGISSRRSLMHALQP